MLNRTFYGKHFSPQVTFRSEDFRRASDLDLPFTGDSVKRRYYLFILSMPEYVSQEMQEMWRGTDLTLLAGFKCNTEFSRRRFERSLELCGKKPRSNH